MDRESGDGRDSRVVDWLEPAADLPHLYARIAELVHRAGHDARELVVMPRSEVDRREMASFAGGWAEAMRSDLPTIRREYERRIAEAYARGQVIGRRGRGSTGTAASPPNPATDGEADVIPLPLARLLQPPATVVEAEERVRREQEGPGREGPADPVRAPGESDGSGGSVPRQHGRPGSGGPADGSGGGAAGAAYRNPVDPGGRGQGVAEHGESDRGAAHPASPERSAVGRVGAQRAVTDRAEADLGGERRTGGERAGRGRADGDRGAVLDRTAEGRDAAPDAAPGTRGSRVPPGGRTGTAAMDRPAPQDPVPDRDPGRVGDAEPVPDPVPGGPRDGRGRRATRVVRKVARRNGRPVVPPLSTVPFQPGPGPDRARPPHPAEVDGRPDDARDDVRDDARDDERLSIRARALAEELEERAGGRPSPDAGA
ncbi:hypothetical protein ACL02U_06310 [Streptomyces sp. MS06]|uniref:hypothetical protein n=1 Tax=Streptomyces sp. MS06 TaxID=3385974 RepID=UPI00399F5C52